jgi:hypothetical protein
MTFGRMRFWLGAMALVCAAGQAAEAAGTKGLPTIDLQSRCKRSERVIVEMTGDKSLLGRGFDMCMRAEQEARDALVKAWPDMPQAYKAFCIKPAAYSPSYIEWIACMEMLIDLRRLREARQP